MAVTIKEIAKLADVSAATVSMALNDRHGISKSTKEKVLKIAKENDYSFFKKNNKAKGILQLTIHKKLSREENDTPFFQASIEGMEMEARNSSYKLNISYVSSSSSINRMINDLKKHPVNGIILIGSEMEEEDFLSLSDINTPILLLDNNFINIDLNSVVIDNVGGMYKATKYLVNKGHSEIGYFQSSIPIHNFKERFEGYNKALSELGIKYIQEHTIQLTPNMDSAFKEMKEYLDKNPKLASAYVADNDLIAMGAMKAIKEKLISIPEQVSIVGFDDIVFCSMTEPALTTINVNKDAYGRLAVSNLIDIIEGKNKCYYKTVLQVDLIERKSVLVNI